MCSSDLSRKEKLNRIATQSSIDGIKDKKGWQLIKPDEQGDWLNLRDKTFLNYIVLGDKKNRKTTLFFDYSSGVQTNRDAWCYNYSKDNLSINMRSMVNFYNEELIRFDGVYSGLDGKKRKSSIANFINMDSSKISWTRGLKHQLAMGKSYAFEESCLSISNYRPFTKDRKSVV